MGTGKALAAGFLSLEYSLPFPEAFQGFTPTLHITSFAGNTTLFYLYHFLAPPATKNKKKEQQVFLFFELLAARNLYCG